MAHRRGRRHPVAIDGQIIWLDSYNEEVALKRFIEQYGFSGRWLRSGYGVKHGGRFYSPDFELAVNDNGNTAWGLVEVKEYRRDFTKNIAERMCAAAKHFRTRYLYLYTTRGDRWYMINSSTITLCTPPEPGSLAPTDLALPIRFLTRNYYGRHYYQSFFDSFFTLVRDFLWSPPKRKRRR